MKHVTRELAIAALNAAVEERGAEFVYAPPTELGYCVYVENGAPSCLIANGLHRLGVEIRYLEMGDKDLSGMSADELCDMLQNGDVMSFDPIVNRLFNLAQSHQDAGIPWGDALSAAVRVTED